MAFPPVIVFVFIFVVGPLKSRSQTFTIHRSSDANIYSKDYFDVQKLQPATSCSAFGGTTAGSSNPRKCACSLQNRPTFGLFSGKWQCVNDADVRASQGCQVETYDQTENAYGTKILVFGVAAKFYHEFSTHRLNVCYKRKLQIQAQYYGCNGTWLPLRNTSNKFLLDWYKMMNNYFKLRNRKQLGPNFWGKLIKISISCNNGDQMVEDCLMIKVEGNTSCSAPPSVVTATPVPSLPVSPSVRTLPVSTSVSVTRNGSLPKTPGGGSSQTSDGDSVGAIVGTVLAVLVVLVGAIVTILILKRRGKLWRRIRRREDIEEKTAENPSYGSIVNLEFSCGIPGSEDAQPQSPVYAAVGKKDSKRKQRDSSDSQNGEEINTTGTQYPEYARVLKTQSPQQASQSVGYDYACSEGPTGKNMPKSVSHFLERCPEHGSTVPCSSSKPNHSDDDDSDDDDDDKGYEYLIIAKDNPACEVSECASNKNEQQSSSSELSMRKNHQPCDGDSSRDDNDGYEVPVKCTIQEQQRALVELFAPHLFSKETQFTNSPPTSPVYSTITNPEQSIYSSIDDEHVYQALLETDVYAPLQDAQAKAPPSPTQTQTLEHEFEETPI